MSEFPQTVYLSIDFEDFAFDKRRDLGIFTGYDMRANALHKSFDIIQAFAERHFIDPRITFFCPGIVAKQCPEVIRRIADHGHEIACHYYYETSVKKDKPDIFAMNIRIAKTILENVSGNKVLGFRAPQFSLDPDDRERYLIVEDLFEYDSSMVVNNLQDLHNKITELGLRSLRIFPIGQHKIHWLLRPCKTGGTYFKIFPAWVAKSLLNKSVENNIKPMLYLHPYEMVADKSFMLRWKDLSGLPNHARTYHAARQVQWHVLGNRGMAAKLEHIFAEFSHLGRMCDLLASDYGKPHADPLGEL